MKPSNNKGTTLTFDLLVKLSADEFTKLVNNTNSLSAKDILIMVTRLENDVLLKMKEKDGEKHDRYIFFKRVLDIMYIAMQAEENVNFWKNVAIRSKMESEFHQQNAAIYYEELMKYKALEEVIQEGTLDKYINEVKARNNGK